MNKDNRARVVMLSLGEIMYPQDFLGKVIEDARRHVAAMNVDLVGAYTIMTEEDGVRVARAMEGLAFDAIIANFVSWHITPYVMQVMRHYREKPVLVWGIGGKTNAIGTLHSPAAAAGITAFVPLLKEMGFRYHVICEKPDEPRRLEEVAAYLDLVGAAKRIRETRIGLIGYADMGLFTCAYDKLAVFNELGIDIEDYFGYEITHAMDLCPEEEARAIAEGIKRENTFQNEIPEATLDKVARLYCAMKGQADRRSLDAISIKCVNGVTGFMGFNPCLAQSLLANRDLSVICECDAYGLLTNVILSKLTGQTSAFMENYEVFDDSVLVGVCGYIPKDFVDGEVQLRSANLGDTNRGISNVSKVKTGQVTFARLYREDNRFKLYIARGEAFDSPKWTELGWNEPTPDFPSMRLKLEMPVQTYLETVPGQHIIMVYGDHKARLVSLCRLLGVEPVCP